MVDAVSEQILVDFAQALKDTQSLLLSRYVPSTSDRCVARQIGWSGCRRCPTT